MEIVVWIALAVIIAAVAIDARPRRDGPRLDPSLISTQKIIVDLSRRR